ncbi:helicase associated domain-containing protein [Brevibacterium sp. SIMBA_078]|uniref:helicase associated domain-containing protein n=1 Tax=Brevibacterium sp. SIMBA_078 TaxID=3085816 RepID=UPI00397E868F
MGRGRVDFSRGINRLSSYARAHGHANPKSGEIWLGWTIGLWVSNLRLKFRTGKLSENQIAEAEAIGVRFSPPYRDPKPKPPTRAERRESDLILRLTSLEPFYREHGHINIRQLYGVDGWSGAGRWIAALRGKYKRGSLPESVIRKAEAMNIKWDMHSGRQQNQRLDH